MSGYARAADVAVARSLDGTLYVMPLPDGPPRVLNGSAAVVWEVAVSGSERVVEEVAAAFGVEVDSIANDVEATVASFVRLGLLEPLPARGDA